MSDDNKISEETIAAITVAAQDIAGDSDAMRQNLEAIAAALQPMIAQAGIRFGSLEESQMWQGGSYPEQVTLRIGIKRYGGGAGTLSIGVEETQLYPETWDGSNWTGHSDPFCDDAYSNHAATICPFSDTSRRTVACIIERLPAFILEYCEELKRRHQKYADLREKAEQIRAILEEA
jgi:hypothetical protein